MHGNPRVLLLADTEAALATLAIDLADGGYAVAITQEPAATIRQLAAQPWAAVVVHLSDTAQALDVARTIQAQQPQLATIVIADAQPPVVIETGLRDGVYDWLPRPYARPLLFAAINRAQERQALQAQIVTEQTPAPISRALAHDINNQLSGIIGLTQLHMSDEALPADVREDLSLVLESARTIRDLLRQHRSS